MQNRWDLSIRIFWQIRMCRTIAPEWLNKWPVSRREFYSLCKEAAQFGSSLHRRTRSNTCSAGIACLLIMSKEKAVLYCEFLPCSRIIRMYCSDRHWTPRIFVSVRSTSFLSIYWWQDTINAQQRAKLFRFLFLSDTTCTICTGQAVGSYSWIPNPSNQILDEGKNKRRKWRKKTVLSLRPSKNHPNPTSHTYPVFPKKYFHLFPHT